MRKRRDTDLIVIYIVTCLMAAWLFLLLPAANPYGLRRPDAVTVTIEPGQKAAAVADEFVRSGLVKSPERFLKWMTKLGFDRKLKPGSYTLRPGTAKQVAEELRDAKPLLSEARILPGALFEEIASSLEGKGGEKLFRAALADDANFPSALRVFLPKEAEDRFLFLSPDTYAVTSGDSAPGQLVRSAARQWWSRHEGDIPPAATSADLREWGVIASIIQKEALFDNERPLMAGVFENRLKKNMPLQSCATVVYAWKQKGEKRTSLTYDDLKIESPYNTYKYGGLPPGHIGVPSESSWKAALRPQQTDKLFFVADKDGRHVFSKTYGEHLAAQRRIGGGK